MIHSAHTCAQLYPTLCDPMDCSPPGSSVPGICRARTLELTSFPTPGALPNPGVEPTSLELASKFFTSVPRGKPCNCNLYVTEYL